MASKVEPPFVSAVKKQRVAPLRFAPVAMTSWWESGYTNKEPAPSVPETSSIHHGGDRPSQHAQLQRMLRPAVHFRAREMSACRSGNEGWLQRFWKGLEHPYHRQPGCKARAWLARFHSRHTLMYHRRTRKPGCFAGYTFRESGLARPRGSRSGPRRRPPLPLLGWGSGAQTGEVTLGAVIFLPGFHRLLLRFLRLLLRLLLLLHALLVRLLRVLHRLAVRGIRVGMGNGWNGKRQTEKNKEDTSCNFLHKLSTKQALLPQHAQLRRVPGTPAEFYNESYRMKKHIPAGHRPASGTFLTEKHST